jgi:plasmid segregation protein ParM
MPTDDLFVLDLGNGDTKVGSGKKNVIESFPSVVGQFNYQPDFNFGGDRKKIDNMSIKREDGKEQAIGQMAIKNSHIRNHDISDDKYISYDNLTISHAAISLVSDIENATGNIIIGLPIHKMNIAKDIIKIYQGQVFGGTLGFCGIYDSRPKFVKIEKPIVVAQPHGTFFNMVLNDKGDIEDKSIAKSGMGIFDIGFKTNDGIVFRNLEPIGRLTIHSKNGMFIAYDEIKSRINHAFGGLEVKIFEIPEIVRSGEVKGLNVSSIINDAFYNLASNIVLEIKSKWSDAFELERIVFTGGGAVLLKPYIEQAFVNAIYKDAKSNAEGMLKYAMRLWGCDVA